MNSRNTKSWYMAWKFQHEAYVCTTMWSRHDETATILLVYFSDTPTRQSLVKICGSYRASRPRAWQGSS